MGLEACLFETPLMCIFGLCYEKTRLRLRGRSSRGGLLGVPRRVTHSYREFVLMEGLTVATRRNVSGGVVEMKKRRVK